MGLFASVLNAECSAATAMFDTVTLHTADPSTTGANKDVTAGSKTLTWSSASGGISTASATWTAVTGTWTHLGLWNSSTFVGSIPRAITFATAENLTAAFRMKVSEKITVDA